MEKLEIIRLCFEVLLALIAAGALKSMFENKKYKQEVEKLKTDVEAAKTNTRSDELDNVKKAMSILMQEVVEPLKHEIKLIRNEVSNLRKAVEKANTCSHAANCTVRDELSKQDADTARSTRQCSS